MKKIIFGIFFIFVLVLSFCGISKAEPSNAPHWNKAPINVYIPNNNEKAASMKRAFLRWQELSYGKLAFNFVPKGPADIDVVFAEKVDGSDGPIGAYKLTVKNGYISKAEIFIVTKNKKYSNNYVFTTMLHEIGHALGLQDKNKKESSIMYMPVSESQDILKIDIRDLYKINNWSFKDKNRT